MTKRELRLKALEIAQNELKEGIREATGHNDGIPAERYIATGEKLPWCAAFVLYCFRLVGVGFPGNPWSNRAVRQFWRNLGERDALLVVPQGSLPTTFRTVGQHAADVDSAPFTAPGPGDLIFVSHRGKSDTAAGWHMGIVERTTDTDITSIDGNIGNRVSRVHRSWADPHIAGFGRWPLDVEPQD